MVKNSLLVIVVTGDKLTLISTQNNYLISLKNPLFY